MGRPVSTRRRFNVPTTGATLPEALRGYLVFQHLVTAVVPLAYLCFVIGRQLFSAESSGAQQLPLGSAMTLVFWSILSLLIAVGLVRRSSRWVAVALMLCLASMLEQLFGSADSMLGQAFSVVYLVALVLLWRHFRDEERRELLRATRRPVAHGNGA